MAGMVKAIRDLSSGNQINTCDSCLKDNLSRGIWHDQEDREAKARCDILSEETIEKLAHAFLSAREGRDQKLPKELEDSLCDLMQSAGAVYYPITWKGKPVTLHVRRMYCQEQPEKVEEARQWLEKHELPTKTPEAVQAGQDYLDRGGYLPPDLFVIRPKIEIRQ